MNLFDNNNNKIISECVKKLSGVNDYSLLQYNKYKNICKIVYNIKITDNPIVINQKFSEFLHLWFNDNVVISEIIKHLRNNGICILKEIIFINNKHVIAKLVYDKEKKQTKHLLNNLNYEQYYNTQIEVCKDNMFAIPFRNVYGSSAHSMILIVKRQPDLQHKLSVEIFEPNGVVYPIPETDIEILLNNLFKYELILPSEIKIINIPKICPNIHIQSKLIGTDYSRTCFYISIWYSINRLLNPEEDYKETYRRMNNYISRYFTRPEIIMKDIILSFINLLDINELDIDENGVINKKNVDTIKIGGKYKKVKKNKTIIKNISKKKYINIIKGGYRRPEKYLFKKSKKQKTKKNYL